MMTIDEFLLALKKEHILLTEEEGKLLCHVKKGEQLKEEYLLFLKEHKNELIKRLKQQIEKTYGLTPLQEGLLFHGLNTNQDASLYCQQKCWELDTNINCEALKRAWELLFQRHEVLRSQLVWQEDDQPKQHILSQVELPWYEEEINTQSDLEEFLSKDWKKGFDISQAPLARITLLKNKGQCQRMIFTHHHLILDGWSSALLIQELEQLYFEQSLEKIPPSQPSRLPSHASLVEWIEQQDKQAGTQFWQTHLSGFEKTGSWPLKTNPSYSPQIFEQAIDPAFSRLCLEFAKQHGITLNAIMQFAWGLLQSIYTGSTEVLFGIVSSGRTTGLKDADKIVGMCINTLPFRVKINSQHSVLDHLRQVHADIQKANIYSIFKLVDLRKYTELKAGVDFFDNLFVFENYPGRKQTLSHNPPWHHRTIQEKTNFPLTLQVFQDTDQGLWLKLQLTQELSAKGPRILQHYEGLLKWLIHHAYQSPTQCDYLSTEEKTQILQWSQGPIKKRDSNVLSIYYSNPHFNSNKILCTYQEQALSFADFEKLTNQWAHLLKETYHVASGDAIAFLFSEPSLAVVIIMAILKLGAHYVPLHQDWPLARQRKAILDAGAQLWITDTDQVDSEITLITYQSQLPHQFPSEFKPEAIASDELVYTIYTSGTTSEPKGASVYHASVSNVLGWCEETTPLETNSKFLIISSLSFDLTQKNILAPVCLGAELHFLPKGRFDVWDILNRIETQKITHLTCTPSVFSLLLEQAEAEQFKSLHSLKHIVFGGEKLRIPKLSDWMASQHYQAKLHNSYGPTECTDIVTCFTFDKIESSEDIPIGTPVPNLTLYILNKDQRLEGIGVPGEICIGGLGVGAGYISDKQLTQNRFLTSPFDTSERIYLTGDWGMWLEDGRLHFIGRKDAQIKFHGHRIDLLEIEKILNKQPEIKQSAVTLQGSEGQEKIIAYFAPRSGYERVDNELLRSQLLKDLPAYMIPHGLIELSEIPLTHHGKLNRAALPALDELPLTQPEHYVAPETPEEQQLATIWAEVFHQAQIGIHDNFFSLGGDSILSIQVVAKARHLGLKLEAQHLFQYPTVHELAKIVHQGNSLPIDQGLAKGAFALSPPQAWFIYQNPLNLSHFNQSCLFDLKHSVSIHSLEQALIELVKHHDALRLRFRKTEDQNNILFYDDKVSAFTPKLHIEQLHYKQPSFESLCNFYQKSLDIEQGPVLAAAYIKEQHKLFIAIHHWVVDTVSWRILLEDFQNLVQHIENKQAYHLPPKTSSYGSWVEGLKKAALSTLQEQIPYWQEQVSDYRPVQTQFNQDYFPKRHETELMHITWTQDYTQKLLTQAHVAYNTHMNDLLLAALSLSFWRWKGMKNLWFTLEGHGREALVEEVDISRTVGWFTSFFPQKLSLNPDFDGYKELIKSIKEQLHAVPFKGAGFGPLKYYLNQDENYPLPNISFNYLGQLDASFNEGWLLSLSKESKGAERSAQETSLFHLDMNASVLNHQLTLRCRYSQKNYSEASIKEWADLFHDSLCQLIDHCTSQKTRTKTPSDFEQVKISQTLIDNLSQQGVLQSAFPLTPLQEGMLFHSLSALDDDVYCTQVCLQFQALNFNVTEFKKVWELMVQQYDVLRTSFVLEGLEKPIQVVYEAKKLKWKEYDWRDETEKKQAYTEFLYKDRQQGFDFNNPGLYRIALIQCSDTEFICVFTHHHLLLDGWSVSLLIDEVVKKYLDGAHTIYNPSKTPKFEHFVKALYQIDKQESKQFWNTYLKDIKASSSLGFANQTLDIHKPVHSVFRVSKIIDPELSQQCRQFAKEAHVSLSTVMEYAWAALLYLYQGEKDIVLGDVISNRHIDVSLHSEHLLGLLIATLPKHIALKLNASIEEQLYDLNLLSQKLVKYSNLSLKEIQDQTQLDPKTPLFTSLFAFENYPVNTLWGTHDKFHLVEKKTFEKNNYPFTLFVIPKSAIELRFVCDAECFLETTIEQLARRYVHLLKLLTETRLSESLDTLLYTFFKEEQINVQELPILPTWNEENCLLSYHQERLRFIDQFETGTVYDVAPSYHNIPIVIHFFSAFDEERLQQAVHALLKQHLILSGVFNQTNFNIEPLSNIDINIHEGSSPTIPSFNMNAHRLKIDISLLSNHQFILTLTIHHSLCDFRSSLLLANQLAAYYLHPLEEVVIPKIQFMDFALWQKNLPEEWLERLFFYWHFQLTLPLQAMKLPEDRPRKAVHYYTPASISEKIPKDLMKTIQQTALECSLSEEELFLGTLQILLAKYANTNEILIGREHENRNRAEIKETIGPIDNLTVIRSQLNPHDELRQHFSKLRQTCDLAELYSDLPFDLLVKMLNPQKDMSRTALFDILFRYFQRDATTQPTHKHVVNYLGYGKYDYIFFIQSEPSGFTLDLIYNSDIYDETSANQLLKHYLYLLQHLPNLLYERIEDIELLSEEEKHLQLQVWNHPDLSFPKNLTLVDRFEEIVASHPNQIALSFENKNLSYEDLNKQANQLAHYLKHIGVEQGFVGLVMARSLDLLVVLLGILKAGAAYLPLDPHSPSQRNQYILEHSKTQYLISGIADWNCGSQTVIHWNEIKAELHHYSDVNPDIALSSNEKAYCIYTSGTTGLPKGVSISHQNVIRLFFNEKPLFDFSSKDNWLLFHSYHFDFSVWEIFGALLFGGRLVILNKEDTQNPERIIELLRTEKITILNQTPTAFFSLSQEIAAQNYPSLDSLGMIIFGGEKLSPGYLKDWVIHYPHMKLINMYGITETTVHVSYKELQAEDIALNRSSIGKAIPTTQMYIMDDHQNMLPPGVIGEIYVGGAGLSQGYLHNPALTAERFIHHPYRNGAFLYRSGDRGKLLANGEVIYQGRNDNQVNIRGFRIELGEIESCLAKIPGITQAVVLADYSLLMTPKIIAYYVANQALKGSDVYAHLSEFLPQYMLPSYLIQVPRIELTIQGKVDKQALPSPTESREHSILQSKPQTTSELILASIWSEVLQRDCVYLEDNFFDLGGDSILIIVAISKAREQSLYLTPKDFFTTATLKELAQIASLSHKIQAIKDLPEKEFPLSPIQHWFFERQLKQPHHFNQSVLLQSKEPLDAKLLQASLINLAQYHDALRLHFDHEKGKQRYQAPTDDSLFPLTVLHQDDQDLEEQFTKIQESLNFENGPMARAVLVPQHNLLLLIIHHLVVDTVSWHLLIQDLACIYLAKSQGDQADLPPKTASFYDWVMALETYKNSWSCKLQKYFWQQIIQSDLPLSNKIKSKSRLNHSFHLNTEQTHNLNHTLAKSKEVSLDDVLFIAAYNACQATLDDTFICYKEGHGRVDSLLNLDLSRTLGWFTSLYPAMSGRPMNQSDKNPLRSLTNLQQWLQLKTKIPDEGIGYSLIRYGNEVYDLEPQQAYRIGMNYLGHQHINTKDAVFHRVNLPRGAESSKHNDRFFDINVIAWMSLEGLELKISYDPMILKNKKLHHFIEVVKESIQNIKDALKQKPLDNKPINHIVLGNTPSFKPFLSWHEEVASAPMFLFPPLLGGAETYIEFAHYLGNERPIYSLESYNLHSGHPPVADLTELAWFYSTVIAAILEEHRTNQKICLGGWSMGGLLAWETANQLSKKSIEVHSLYLMDTPLTLSPSSKTSFEHYLSQMMDVSKIELPLMEQLYKIHEAERQAMAHYNPSAQPFNVVLFSATESYKHLKEDWSQMTNTLKCYEFAGSHFDVMKKEHLEKIAAIINTNIKAKGIVDDQSTR